MKGNRVMIAMLAALCVPSAFAASPQVQKHGIQDYRVEETLNQKRIFLLNENNEEVGVVNVTSEPYRKIIRLTKKSGSQLLIEWALVDQKVKITDLTTGETAEAAGRKGARPQAGMPALIEKYRAEIEMVANVLQDVSLGSRRLKARRLDSLGGVSPGGGLSSTPTAKLYGDSCSGNWVRGTSTQDTRSACCQLAADNANSACWNQYCVGCCALLSCDAACLVGDYLCTCGISGQMCSSSDYPAGDGDGGGGSGGGSGGGGDGGGGGGPCHEGDIVSPDQCVEYCGGYVSGDYCMVP